MKKRTVIYLSDEALGRVETHRENLPFRISQSSLLTHLVSVALDYLAGNDVSRSAFLFDYTMNGK